MTPIQEKIKEALDGMGEKSKFTDAVLSKKLREILNLQGKKKAIIALSDLLEAIEDISQSGKIFSVTITAANDLLIERTENKKEIPLENKQRRQRHEKSQELFTNGDLNSKEKSQIKSKKPKDINAKKRTERKTLNIYERFEDE